MIENYDEINHFIYNKIEKYNEKFAEFKKTLDLQDDNIKKKCGKTLKKHIKKNPKKIAQKFINLAQNNEDTTETTELEENETKKLLKGGMMNKKNFLKGGMVDDDDIELKIEEIPEEETLINTSYKTLFIGIFLFCILYIFIFSISYYMDAENFYNNIMFTPLLFFVKSI
tara:strand:- start:1516 stop:2025 length:510 start_codon:yes stop_codon:yes gene_type:complete